MTHPTITRPVEPVVPTWADARARRRVPPLADDLAWDAEIAARRSCVCGRAGCPDEFDHDRVWRGSETTWREWAA